MLKLAAFFFFFLKGWQGGGGGGVVWDSFFKGHWHITEKSSYRAPKKLPWACQDGVSLRQKLLPACHMHREMCDFSMYCVHRGHLIKAHRWIRGDTQLSGMQTPVLSFPAIWTCFLKRALGEDGHGCVCFPVLCVCLGTWCQFHDGTFVLLSVSHLLSLFWGLLTLAVEDGTCRESPVNMVCKGRRWLLGNAQMKTNALLSFYGPRLRFH